MARIPALAVCLLAALIIDGAPTTARAQTPAARRIGALIVDEGFAGSGLNPRSGALVQRATGPRYVPHRHWSWLFPSTPVPPFASDPLMRRHWWLDPLLRRHW